MKMIFEKAGKTYVFERETIGNAFETCGHCANKEKCNHEKLFDVDVWLYCISLLPTIYICVEVIDGSY